MKTPSRLTIRSSLLAALVALLALVSVARAQVTNWVAYNDHRPGPLIPPHVPTPNSWGTGTNVTIVDMGDPGGSGPLVDHRTGNLIGATLTTTRTGGADNFGTLGRPMPTNSPMAQLFLGTCDLSNDGLVGVRTNGTDHRFVLLAVSGLNPAKRYVFRGTTSRNGGYGNRWSFTAISAVGFTDAHISPATGPGVLTVNNFPAGGFAPGQAAFNSGANPEGAVVGWNDIAPFPDGTFTIFQDQYVGPIPGGVANNGPYGYAFTAMMLAEVEIVAPTITVNPAPTTTVEQNRPLSLSVAATGAPLNYQWYKGPSEIQGATLATYSVPLAQVGDSGSYYAVVYNSLARRTSTVAQVTVFADVTAPAVESIFSYPTLDGAGVATLDQIIIEFNEPVTPASVSSPASYTVPGGGNPVSVIVTNERSVVLMLGTPLAQDTDYSVTLSGGATDAANNVAGSSSAPFHSWVPGLGNGLLMESYDVAGTDITVESLLASPNYPNNPFRRDTLRAFDSRLVFPDDTREGYGARIAGVFIPPVSGGWIFFARTRNLGLLKLNPNGTDPAGAIEILRQSTENAPFNWDRLSSSVYQLRAGRAYYIEGLYKGATGPDYLKAAARLAGTGVPTPVDTLDTQVDPNSMTGGYIGFPLAPRNAGGALSITQDLPANVSAEENNLVTLSIQVSNPSKLPLQYQWFRGGVEIAGATGPSYTIQPTIAADNGATFSVRVAKVGSVLTSRTTTLNVVPDVTRPRVLSANSSYQTPNYVTVRFNEPLFSDDAQNPFGYEVTGNVPLEAVLQPDQQTVVVQFFNAFTPGQDYQLRVLDVTDLALLKINPNPTLIQFVGGSDLPKLTITLNFDYVDITWPATSSPFTLEEADALLDPPSSIVWTPVGSPPILVDGRNFISLTTSSAKKFFRLRQ